MSESKLREAARALLEASEDADTQEVGGGYFCEARAALRAALDEEAGEPSWRVHSIPLDGDGRPIFCYTGPPSTVPREVAERMANLLSALRNEIRLDTGDKVTMNVLMVESAEAVAAYERAKR